MCFYIISCLYIYIYLQEQLSSHQDINEPITNENKKDDITDNDEENNDDNDGNNDNNNTLTQTTAADEMDDVLPDKMVTIDMQKIEHRKSFSQRMRAYSDAIESTNSLNDKVKAIKDEFKSRQVMETDENTKRRATYVLQQVFICLNVYNYYNQ